MILPPNITTNAVARCAQKVNFLPNATIHLSSAIVRNNMPDSNAIV